MNKATTILTFTGLAAQGHNAEPSGTTCTHLALACRPYTAPRDQRPTRHLGRKCFSLAHALSRSGRGGLERLAAARATTQAFPEEGARDSGTHHATHPGR